MGLEGCLLAYFIWLYEEGFGWLGEERGNWTYRFLIFVSAAQHIVHLAGFLGRIGALLRGEG